ncbi:MAG: O-antigen ligase family protein [Pseudomonadota bacterium]|nr:O-antigen ligase family protein [Pseudomonadota bacterium]
MAAGLLWLMVGMVTLPAGVALNPGKLYQGVLIVLLYLPAFGLALTGRAVLWRALLSLATFRVFLLLLGWAAITLFWSPVNHPGDEVARLLSILAFVLGWQLWTGGDDQRAQRLLWLGGMGMAVAAAGYAVLYLLQPPDDGRIVADGVTATANYAAAVMGASLLWLYQLPVRGRSRTLSRLCAMLALLAFIGMTQTRSVWLAIAMCLLLAPLWDRRRRAWPISGAVLLLTVAAMWIFSSVLLERGTSLRPQLFMQSLILIGQHPWLGLGQGASFILSVAGEGYTHSHNVLTQTAIQLGLPGLILAVSVWLMVGWQAWRHRHTLPGRLLFSMWVYASVVLQFDMPQLLDSPRPSWLLFWLPFAMAVQMGMHDGTSPAISQPLAGTGERPPLHCRDRV